MSPVVLALTTAVWVAGNISAASSRSSGRDGQQHMSNSAQSSGGLCCLCHAPCCCVTGRLLSSLPVEWGPRHLVSLIRLGLIWKEYARSSDDSVQTSLPPVTASSVLLQVLVFFKPGGVAVRAVTPILCHGQQAVPQATLNSNSCCLGHS